MWKTDGFPFARWSRNGGCACVPHLLYVYRRGTYQIPILPVGKWWCFFLLVDAWSFITTYFLVWWGLAPLSIFQPALKALNYHHGSPYNSCRKDLRKPSSGWRVGSFWDVGSHHWGNAPRLWQTILSMAIGGHFRILDWRYLPYIREYPHQNMVLSINWSYLSWFDIYQLHMFPQIPCIQTQPWFSNTPSYWILKGQYSFMVKLFM